MIEIENENQLLKIELSKREWQRIMDSIWYREYKLMDIIAFFQQQGHDSLAEESRAILKENQELRWSLIKKANDCVNKIDKMSK